MDTYGEKLASRFYTGIMKDNKIYTQNSEYNLWVSIDRFTGKMSLLKNIKNYNKIQVRELRYITEYADAIYRLDFDCAHIIEYNLKDNKCETYFMGDMYQGKFYAITYNEHIYIYPFQKNVIICFNMINKKIEIKNREDSITGIEFYTACQVDKNIFFFSENEIIKVDYTGKKLENYKIPLKMSKCINALYQQEKIYALSDCGMILEWDLINNEMQIIRAKENEFMEFGQLICTKKYIWLLPCFGEGIIKIDLENRKNEEIIEYPDNLIYNAPANWNKYGEKIETEEEYIVPCHSSQYILIINKNSGKEEWLKIIAPSHKEMMSTIFEYVSMMNEGTYVSSLRSYLEFLS